MQVCTFWPQAGDCGSACALCIYQSDGSAHPRRPESCVLPPLAAKSDQGGESWRLSIWKSMDTSKRTVAWVLLAGQAFIPGCIKAVGCSHWVPVCGACPCSPRPMWGCQGSIFCWYWHQPHRYTPVETGFAAGRYRPELMLANGVTLSGLVIEVSCSKDSHVTAAFSLGQAAPSCIPNTSWGFYPSQWDCRNGKVLLDTGRGTVIWGHGNNTPQL